MDCATARSTVWRISICCASSACSVFLSAMSKNRLSPVILPDRQQIAGKKGVLSADYTALVGVSQSTSGRVRPRHRLFLRLYRKSLRKRNRKAIGQSHRLPSRITVHFFASHLVVQNTASPREW